MKIGIITVHNGQNYGASLQAYALIQLLKKMGHEANLIDYRTKKIEDRMQSYKELSRWDSIKNIKKICVIFQAMFSLVQKLIPSK